MLGDVNDESSAPIDVIDEGINDLFDEHVDADEDLIAAIDSLVLSAEAEYETAAPEMALSNSRAFFPDPKVATLSSLRWPKPPKQWSGDLMPKQDPKRTSEVPDPAKRNEQLQKNMRGYFSVPLPDPENHMMRQVHPPNGLDRDFTNPLDGKLPPPAPITATHMTRKLHNTAMETWLQENGKMVRTVANRDVPRLLAAAYGQGRRERSDDALDEAEAAVRAREDLHAAELDLRAALAEGWTQRRQCADRAAKIMEIEQYCAAMRDEATARREEVLALKETAQRLLEERSALAEQLEAKGADVTGRGAVTAAGLDAEAAALTSDLKVLSKW